MSALTGEPLFELWCWCHIHSTLAMTVKEGGVGTVAQQQGTHLHPVLRGGLMERRELPEVHGIHTGTMLQGETCCLVGYLNFVFNIIIQLKPSVLRKLLKMILALVSKPWIILPKPSLNMRESIMMMTYFEQKLCDLKVAIGTSIMKRNKAAAESGIRIKKPIQVHVFVMTACLTLCPWRERQPRVGGGAEQCGLGCSRQPGGAVWTAREESLLTVERRWSLRLVLPKVRVTDEGQKQCAAVGR